MGKMQGLGNEGDTGEVRLSPGGKEKKNKIVLCLASLTHFGRVCEVRYSNPHLKEIEIQRNCDSLHTSLLSTCCWAGAVLELLGDGSEIMAENK